MIAEKNFEKLEHSAVRLTMTVKKDEVKKSYDELLAEYAKSVQLKGFRKGKVPPSILERKFGEDLKIEAMGKLMEKSVEEALEGVEDKPLSYANPSVDGEPKMALDADFIFSVKYDVFPQVKVTGYEGISIEIPACTIGEKDEERELEELRERNAIVIEKEDGKGAERTDVLTLDYIELDDSGNGIPSSERKEFAFTLGSGYNPYKFDDELAGMKKDEEKTFVKEYPADYEDKELAGKKVNLKVKLTKVKARQLPELDDDFAQDISEKYSTLADLKAAIKRNLQSRLEVKVKKVKEQAILDELINRSTIDLPESMVNFEMEGRLRNLMGQFGADEARLESLLASSGRSRQSLFDEWRPSSEKSLKSRLILEKLVADEKIEESEEELEAEFAKMATESSLEIEAIKDEYKKKGMTEYLRDTLKEDKLFAKIFALAKLKTGKKMDFVDFLKDNE